MQLPLELGLVQTHQKTYPPRIRIQKNISNTIVAPQAGILEKFDFLINPYSLYKTASSYLYAAFLIPDLETNCTDENWPAILKHVCSVLESSKNSLNLFIGSVSDPYENREEQIRLTRKILAILAKSHSNSNIVIQTRSPLILDDIPLLNEFPNLRVNVSIPTDDQYILSQFEQNSPSIESRLNTLSVLNRAGINTCACISPMLPIKSPAQFATQLELTKTKRIATTPLHRGKSPFRSTTRQKALTIAKNLQWGGPEYIETLLALRNYIPFLSSNGSGFQPE